jgi:outer membrane protein assembly factor BamB
VAADEFVSAWKKAVDAKNGKIYYFNASTGQTSWTQPADFIDTPASSVAALPVPPPWRRVVDAAGGVYYHNMETNATSWTLPVQEVARSLLTQPAELPAPWRRIADTTGTYYFNSETKETTWTLPVKPDGSAGAEVAAAKCVDVVDGAAGVT